MMKFDKLLLLAIAVLIIASTASCSDDAGNEPVPVPESTVDTKPWNYNEHMDTSVAPGDDFFMYCVGNGGTTLTWDGIPIMDSAAMKVKAT